MDIERRLLDYFAPFRRTAWLPLVLEQDGPAWASKFGGAAFLPEGESHPICPNCGRPLQLLLQLDVANLPEPQCWGADGLVQLFYCTNVDAKCESKCQAFAPGSRSVVARRVAADTPGGASSASIEHALAPKHIVEWSFADDYPDFEEPVSRQFGEQLTVDEFYAWIDNGLTLVGEKLGGWPAWVQGADRPPCPKCSRGMEAIFQIDSNDLVDLMWGDVGVAHLFQCGEHPDELAFTWECH